MRIDDPAHLAAIGRKIVSLPAEQAAEDEKVSLFRNRRESHPAYASCISSWRDLCQGQIELAIEFRSDIIQVVCQSPALGSAIQQHQKLSGLGMKIMHGLQAGVWIGSLLYEAGPLKAVVAAGCVVSWSHHPGQDEICIWKQFLPVGQGQGAGRDVKGYDQVNGAVQPLPGIFVAIKIY
ncbi:MAG: hypothetical protein MZV70_36390 [Desulfobacterales bacterium]|nr:hypothetical protein [Desulfobacterales bacterium]